MGFTQWFHNWLAQPRTRQVSRTRPLHGGQVRPRLEQLEDRTLLSSWTLLPTNVPNYPNVHFGPMIQLSDGTVMIQQGGQSNQWFQLAPDASGNYINGSWSQLNSMNVSREYYGSNLLPSGKLFVIGGEYSSLGGWTNTGEIFDPTANSGKGSWTRITNFPQSQFGDDPTQLLPNGKVLAGYLSGPQTYVYDPVANTWTQGPTKLHNDRSDEETWVKLPDGSILSYDIFASLSSGTLSAQRYIPSQNQWVDASNVDPQNPPGLLTDNGGEELGPATLLPDGRVFFLGANGSTGNTAFYNPSINTWSAGPTLPDGCTASDTPGALLPNGDVLFHAWNSSHDYVFEFNPNNTTNPYTDVTPQNFFTGGNHPYMLVLPTGQVLMSSDASNKLEVYTPDSGPNVDWRPNITDIYQQGNGVVSLTGTQLNGISQGALWGDDNEAYTNFPLVQLVGVPFLGNPYLRTFNWSSTGVAEGNTPESVNFQLGNGIDVLLHVIGSGIASPTVLNIEMSPSVNNITLRRDPNNTADLEILNNGTFFDDVPFRSFSSIIVTGAVNTSNHLTVDYSTGGFFATPVTFDGGAALTGPNNTLTVADASDSNFRYWYVNNSSITGYDASLNELGYVTYHQVQTVALDSGSGGSTMNIFSTSAGTTTNLVAGGSTTVNVGYFLNSVQGIQGTLNLENPPYFNTINVYGSADSMLRNVVLALLGSNPADSEGNGDPWGTITGLAPAPINYEYADTSSLNVYTGSGGANVTVLATGSVPTSLIGNTAASNTLIGPNAPATWNITAQNTGTLTSGISFTAFQNLTGGAGNDDFIFADGAGVDGTIDGGGGSNTFDMSAYSSSVTVDLTADTAPVVGGTFANIQNFIGSGAGGNSLNGPATDTIWNLSGSDAGTLTGGFSFIAFGDLNGGAGNNTFVFADGASVDGTITGGGGTNTLDYSAYISDVIVDLQTGFATGVAGGVAGINNVNGANSGGTGLYNLLIGDGGNVLTGGSGRRNILVAGASASTLIGGTQDDLLIGGMTSYDNAGDNLASWQQIASYWTGTDSFDTRVNNLLTGNGVPLLDTIIVSGNGGGNTLTGDGELALLYSDGADTISGFDPNSQTVTISP